MIFKKKPSPCVGIRTCSDYSPFGVELDERTVSSGYRYGFQNQEKDDEVYGFGNSYTAEFWQYSSRLARRWNIDPVVKSHESSYATFANSPIWLRDINGSDTTLIVGVQVTSSIKKGKGVPSWVPKGTKLESTLYISILIRNGKVVNGYHGIGFETEIFEHESPVLWGMNPAFTRIENEVITYNNGIVYGKYEAVTQLSTLEVMGQFMSGLVLEQEIQTNIITIRQIVHFSYDVKNNNVKVTLDGSSFPEHDFDVQIHTIESELGRKGVGADIKSKIEHVVLKQSNYSEAIHNESFKERNHKNKSNVKADF
jgi:hypothetical protein